LNEEKKTITPRVEIDLLGEAHEELELWQDQNLSYDTMLGIMDDCID
jgi:hypothetical protein